MNQITIYGVSAFDINSAELVDVLKINNNGEICDDENGYSIEERAPRLKEILSRYDYDLKGFQE